MGVIDQWEGVERSPDGVLEVRVDPQPDPYTVLHARLNKRIMVIACSKAINKYHSFRVHFHPLFPVSRPYSLLSSIIMPLALLLLLFLLLFLLLLPPPPPSSPLLPSPLFLFAVVVSVTSNIKNNLKQDMPES